MGHDQYHLLIQDQPVGPLGLSQLTEMLESGEVQLNTLCSPSPSGDWKPIQEEFPWAARTVDLVTKRAAATAEKPRRLRWPLLACVIVAAVTLGIMFKTDETILIVLLIVAVGLYILPAILARRHRNRAAITALNILLGWTFIGWVVALVWALYVDRAPKQQPS